VFELAEVVEVHIPSHDGVELHAAEYHPNVTEGERTPVVIQLSPYLGNLAPEAQAQHEAYWTELLVSRGYTVVHASVRGTGYSGGCFQLGGPVEIQDAYELVEHYHEADWSNGNVSLIGVSYPGTTPWQAAITNPPGLKTIVPMEGISDMYRYDHVNGASYTHGPAFPTYYTATVDWALVPQNAQGPKHVLPPLEAACPGVAERIANGWETLASGDHDAFWDERDYEAHLEDIEVPVFLVHGFQDWNVDPDNGVPIFERLPEGSKAWLGQWAHNYPFANSYNEEWERHDWNATLVAWFDEHLKGKDTGIMEEPAVLAQTSRGSWHRSDTWPPQEVTREVAYLTTDGLSLEPGEEEEVSMGPHVPSEQVGFPGLGDAISPQQLTFTSERFQEDTVIVGQPTLTLNVSLDQPDGHLVATLYDPDAEGGPSSPSWLGHAILNLAHRESRDAGEPMPEGSFEQVTLTFFPMDVEIPAGHRLQLVLTPEADGWIHPSPYAPTYTFQLGGDAPATFTFDVLDDPVFEQAPIQGSVPWSE
ncbi:MAG: CocE/NonD family hydrolase, partial [Candidatus Thermoplasmatota archaeon]|nr:CocE/NonD family hydrolase [Candidatus Thermoplasmatota archaeon]